MPPPHTHTHARAHTPEIQCSHFVVQSSDFGSGLQPLGVWGLLRGAGARQPRKDSFCQLASALYTGPAPPEGVCWRSANQHWKTARCVLGRAGAR